MRRNRGADAGASDASSRLARVGAVAGAVGATFGPAAAAGWLGAADRASAIVLALGVAALAASDSAAGGRWTRPRRAGDRDDGAALILASLTGLLLAGVIVASLAENAARQDGPSGLRALLGALLLAGGAGLRAAAIRRLGASFRSEASPNAAFVQDGIYACCRHPSELGLLLFVAGVCVAAGATGTALVALPLLVGIVASRVRLEERALVRAFGDDYVRYRAATPCLGWGRRESNRTASSRSPERS